MEVCYFRTSTGFIANTEFLCYMYLLTDIEIQFIHLGPHCKNRLVKMVVSDAFSFDQYYLVKTAEKLVKITKFLVVLTNKILVNKCI